MAYLNLVFNFLFVNSKINTLLFFCSTGEGFGYDISEELFDESTVAKSIYKKQIRRFLGLGFFLSFIPGTEPYIARKELFSTIEKLESKMGESEEKPMYGLVKSPFHMLARTLMVLVYFHVNSDFDKVFPDVGQLNRLNPFLYPFELLKFFFLRMLQFFDQSEPEDEEEQEPEWPSFLLIISVIAVIIVLPVFFAINILILSYLGLYFITELALNSLNSLLIEPFKFIYEAIEQFMLTQSLGFTYLPTNEYQKINKLLEALNKEKLEETDIEKSIVLYKTKEFTLLEAPEKLILPYENHRNSCFFQFYKDSDLFQKSSETIRASNNLFTNLSTFSYFSRTYIPQDVIKLIANTCLTLNPPIAAKEDQSMVVQI
ncbi:MAG: hypothetical protein H0U57_10435 [Tatlockia sp.]|nr:hypothetical protein [Tatlockia sp.]